MTTTGHTFTLACMSNTNSVFHVASSDSFVDQSQPQVDWIWQGYLARGAMTLLTSQWKAGKTTLLSVLLARLAGDGQLAGLTTAKSKAAIVSEERLESWRRRHDRLQFGDNLVFLCRPFSARPTYEHWLALIDQLARLGEERGVELVVIDPLSPFLPGSVENQSSAIQDVLHPLERLTAAGQSVLLLHHPRKGESAPGQSSRGSGALCASVDVLMEMKLPPNSQPQDRRRKLLAWSRFDETPRERVIELSTDGTDYCESQIDTDTHREDYVATVEHLLTCPPRKLTRMQLLKHWPKKSPAPHPVPLWRALDGAVKNGVIEQEGSGRKRDPFRYFVPGLDATWQPDIDDILDLPSFG